MVRPDRLAAKNQPRIHADKRGSETRWILLIAFIRVNPRLTLG
jgi:hypothetical protein